METLTETNYIEIIETVISSLGQEGSAMVLTQDTGHLWRFTYGTVEVFVQLSGVAPEDILTVWASVLSLPAKNEAQLMQRLLEMNWAETFEARFAIFNYEVVVVTSRNLEDLSAAEISRLITVVATIADEHDEALQAEFG